jgi:hypothetical protein
LATRQDLFPDIRFSPPRKSADAARSLRIAEFHPQSTEGCEPDPEESKHGEELYQNAGGGNGRYDIDSRAGWNSGEPQDEKDDEMTH